MRNKINWLRISYWIAGIADFIVAILTLIPSRMGVDQHVYPMGMVSAIAASWGVLLIMADREPVQRRWILVPTMLVVALLGAVALHAGLVGLVPLLRIIPSTIASLVVFSILAYSYVNSRDLARSSRADVEVEAAQ